MNKKYKRMKLIGLLLTILIVCVSLASCQTDKKGTSVQQEVAEVVLPDTTKIPSSEVKYGKYTIFQYCQNGWTNHLYATAYYENDKKIYAELREYPGEFIPIDGQTLPIPEWIEDTDGLMNYGFWEPVESDW